MGIYLSTVIPLLMGEICGHLLFSNTIQDYSKYTHYMGHLKSWMVAAVYWLLYIWMHYNKYVTSFNVMNFILTVQYCIIVESLIFYSMHRLQHTKTLYQHSHKVHHSIHDITYLDGDNLHNIDVLMNATAMLMPALTSYYIHHHKLSLYGWYSFLFIRQFITTDCHSSLDAQEKTILSLIPSYMTRDHHHVHHKVNKKKNFGYYKIWEQLFGTYYPPRS